MNKRMMGILAGCLLTCLLGLSSCKEKEVHVLLETTQGNIELKLYNLTPLHRDNFKALVKEGAYDSLLFHRVIRDFMQEDVDRAGERHAEFVEELFGVLFDLFVKADGKVGSLSRDHDSLLS